MRKEDAEVEVPLVSDAWRAASIMERLAWVSSATGQVQFAGIVPVSCSNDGRVTVQLVVPIGAAQRGILLREFERTLKERVDSGITVWVSATSDKNALRKLRGVEVSDAGDE